MTSLVKLWKHCNRLLVDEKIKMNTATKSGLVFRNTDV